MMDACIMNVRGMHCDARGVLCIVMCILNVRDDRDVHYECS